MFLNQAVLILVLAVVLANGQSPLDQIKSRITQSGHLNAESLGPTLAGYLSTALHSNDIAAYNISIQATPTSLTVTFDAVVWGTRVHSVFYFFLINNDVEMAFTFADYGSLLQIYAYATNGKPAPEAVQDLRGTGYWQVSFASASDLPVKIQKGLTLQGQATIVNGTVLKAIRWIQPHITQLDVSASLFIPIFSAHPEDISLNLAYSGPLQLSKTLTMQSLQLTANVPTDFDFVATLQATLKAPSGQNEVLLFQVSGSLLPNQQQLVLQGSMTGTWSHPLGLKWLTITSAQAKLVIGSDDSQSFSINAKGNVDFASAPVSIVFTIGGPDFQNILIAMENIPVNKQLQEIYKDLTGKPASNSLSQVTLTGTASIAVATYNTGQFQEGFTIAVDATLTEGSLLKASQVLKKDATPSTFKYVATLYLPIFTQAEIQFTLAETGAFPITSRVKCDDYSLEVDLADESKIVIKADLETLVKDQTELKFQLTGDFEQASESVTFTGNLLTPWPQPFGLKWLIINSGQVTLTLGGSDDFSLSFTGSAALAFVMTGPVGVTISISGPELQNALFKVSGIPLNPTTVDLICYYLMGMTQTPSEIKALHPTGTATVAISTYDARDVKEGFTFKADVTLQDTGDLYKVARFFNQDPATVTFNLALYISVFQQNPQLEFSVTENGPFPLSHGITVNAYSIDVVLSAQPSISVSAGVSIQFKHQSGPLMFQVSADWSAASANLALSGTMSGNWEHPFGAKWLVITNVGVNLVLGAPTGIISLSLSGTGNFQFNGNSGDASISISVANDLDLTLSAKINNKWTVYEMAKDILGSEPGALVKDINSHGSVSLAFTLSTASGVTLDVSGQIGGDLQNQVKHVSYWWDKDLAGVTFDVSLNLPIFTTNPLAVSISLTFAEEIRLTDHLWFESVAFSLNAAPPVSISLDGKIKAEFKSNPTLYFEANGAFKGDGSVLLWGAMEGTWQNPFGIRGFSLSDVIIEFGFNPSMCAVDACISDLGLGLQMQIGNTIVKFDGNAAAPDFLDVFLAGSISSAQKTLPVVSVIDSWNAANPNRPVSKSNIPADWSLNECSFYFAPEDGQFGPIHYTRGFGITAGMTLLSMNLFVSLNCTGDAGLSCSFAFDVHVTIDQFTQMIKKELGLMRPNMTNFDIFTVKGVRLSEWSQQNVAGGTQPRWNIDMVVFNKPQTLDFRVEQYELSQSFHEFFKQWLAHLFG